MKKYKLYDAYEEKELLAECDTMAEVRKACRKRDEETDGEWFPVLYKLDKDKTGEGKTSYKRFESWNY